MADNPNTTETGTDPDQGNPNWNPKGHKVPPGNSDGSPTNYDNWTWKQIVLAVTGSVEVDQTVANDALSATSSPLTFWNAAVDFLGIQSQLTTAYNTLTKQVNDLVGPGGSWSGTAADAFNSMMAQVNAILQGHVNTLGGSPSYYDTLVDAGDSLATGINNINTANSKYANLAIQRYQDQVIAWDNYVLHGGPAVSKPDSTPPWTIAPDGTTIVAISTYPDLVEQMTQEMRGYIKTLAGDFRAQQADLLPPSSAQPPQPGAVNQPNLNLNIPNNLISIPNNFINIPDNLINIPNNLLNVPNNLINIPDNLINIPNNLLNVPNNLINIPNNLLNVPNVAGVTNPNLVNMPGTVGANVPGVQDLTAPSGAATPNLMNVPDTTGLATPSLTGAGTGPGGMTALGATPGLLSVPNVGTVGSGSALSDLPPGTTVTPDGQVIGPGGQLLGTVPPGTTLNSAGQLVSPDGQILGSVGSGVQPASLDNLPAGTTVAPNGDVIGPDGQLLGTVPPGSTITPNGELVGPNGQPLGSVSSGTGLRQPNLITPESPPEVTPTLVSGSGPLGVGTLPAGSKILPNGEVVGPNGQVLGTLPAGTTVGPNGELIGPDGEVLGKLPAGTTVGPNGELLDAEGMPIGSLPGKLATAGAAESALSPLEQQLAAARGAAAEPLAELAAGAGAGVGGAASALRAIPKVGTGGAVSGDVVGQPLTAAETAAGEAALARAAGEPATSPAAAEEALAAEGRAATGGYGPMPMGGMGGMGMRGDERERTTWLTEDEDIWGADPDAGPTVLGRRR